MWQIQHFCDRDNLLCEYLVGDEENQTFDKENQTCDKENQTFDKENQTFDKENQTRDKESQTCDKDIKSLVANLESSTNDNLDYSGNLLVWRQPVHRLWLDVCEIEF